MFQWDLPNRIFSETRGHPKIISRKVILTFSVCCDVQVVDGVLGDLDGVFDGDDAVVGCLK